MPLARLAGVEDAGLALTALAAFLGIVSGVFGFEGGRAWRPRSGRYSASRLWWRWRHSPPG